MNAAMRNYQLHAPLVMPALLLCLVGLVMVSSASLSGSLETPSSFAVALRHGVYLGGALLAFLVVSCVPLDFWRSNRVLLMGLAIALCALVLVDGVGVEVKGAQRWIDIGPVSLQPIEPTKWLVLVYIAATLAKHAEPEGLPLRSYLEPVIALGVLSALVYLQPDFGSIVLLWILVLAMAFLAGMRFRHLLAIGATSVAALGLLAVAASYRLDRLTAFLNPWQFATTEGYQSVQAQIAFGRGELLGLGLGDGVQKLSYLPEAHNDFIFAVIAEELGFLGTSVVVLLFAWLIGCILRVGRMAWRDDDRFAALIAWGVGISIGLQALINFGVNLGVLPTKGLTLPLVSYGGNSLLVTGAMLGLVARVDKEQECS